MATEEELFDKAVPVKLKSNDRDERQVTIGVAVILNTVSTPVHKKELIVRLTNETDPFFLFTLSLAEEDFQSLKVQQGLLVDFGDFPQKLIGLLELCLSETNKDNPKFLLQFCESSGHPASSASQLHVVETNPFRHLNHLSLKLVPASDLHLKKYLAKCLIQLKRESASLSDKLSSTQSDLSSRLTQCEEALHNRTQELDKLKSDWSSRVAALTSEHASSLNVEREKSLRTQTEVQTRLEQEKRDLVKSHLDRLASVEGRVQELDHSNKELTDHKFRSEATIRELEVRLKSSEEECSRLREEAKKLRNDNSTLYNGTQEHEKSLTRLRTQLAILEQELKAKEQVIGQDARLLSAAQEQKKRSESSLAQKERQITKLDTAFNKASQEVLKGNEIIQKLQLEIRNIKSKLKMRTMVTTQQENILAERDKTIDALRVEVESLRKSVSLKEEELVKSETAAKETRERLDEAKEQLKTNENVISWLNKQVTDQKLGHGGRIPVTGLLPVGFSSIKLPNPPYSATATTSGVLGSSYAALAAAQNMPQFSSTPTNGLTSTSSAPQQYRASSLPTQRHRNVLGSLSSQENVSRQQQQQQQQQVLFKGGVKKTVPSPLSEHVYVAKGTTHPSGGSPPGNEKEPVAPKHSPTEGEPWLDPKYLPSEPCPSDATARGAISNPYATVTPGVMLKSSQGVVSGRTRLQGTVPGRLKPATLASSYFPKS